jgi:predicted MFS family arabinose efflux permease
VFAIGVGNALNLPAWSAVLPSLVGRRDLPGAISLNSTQVNLSRVIGPAIAGVLYPIVGPSWIFVINAATYLFVVAALLSVRFPAVPASVSKGWDNLVMGIRVARSNAIVGRILVTLPLFSFFCLPFIGLFPAIAAGDLGLDTDTFAYGVLYACFGIGAAIGALSIGTVLADADKAVVTRVGLLGFAVAIFVFGLLRSPAIAYAVVLVLGIVYFGTVTAMMTVLQQTLADEVRGRVMALWFMAFGGTVPLGALVFGPILDATSSTVLLSIAGGMALLLAWWCDLPAAVVRAQGRVAA